MTEEEDQSDGMADLLSIVSHDVKNGLNVINLGAHQLTSMKGVDPEAAARLKRIADMLTRASKRMGDLMRDIVDLARIEDENLVLEAKIFRVQDAIKSAVDSHAREAEEKRVGFELSVDGNLYALGDQERVSNVVGILLSNAIRVSNDDTKVTISASAFADRARIEVRDLGLGVPDEELPTLFVRPKPKRGHKRSLGRGLPLAHGVLLVQGGTIDVETKSGEGAAFVVTLPRATP